MIEGLSPSPQELGIVNEPESVEAEKNSELFELTSEAMRRALHLRSISSGDYIREKSDELSGFLNQYYVQEGLDYWDSDYLAKYPAQLLGYLLKGTHTDAVGYGITFPQKLDTLEVGGYNEEDDYWATLPLFKESNVDYTGITINRYAELPSGDRKSSGCHYETYRMDAENLSTKFPEKFDLVFGMGFLGAPMRYGAQERFGLRPTSPEMDKREVEYSTTMMKSIYGAMQEGGLALFINREKTPLTAQYFANLGFEAVEFRLGGFQCIVLRKTPELEKKEKESENLTL